ncbi:MAG TPA: hypothetical protein PK168_01825 [Candidatus Paceibacterota bacterium]|jgi:hypothetical protein|nr:hypothetical protein [Parcubacteria group bacterium]HOM33311.1 hypothetical protein [Candidatus Paceibacterota bacterium]HPC37550.1 hypothetical protein [Candidatus Paceibacterota bacterium]HRU35988.1 hypothetical protein [Candidatus Paceibacterota bacterium]
MILTTHFITGATITKLIPNKPLAYLLAFLSHFFLDIFPHSDYSLKNLDNGIKDKKFYIDLGKICLDLFSGIIFIIISANVFDNFKIGPAIIGGFLSTIPDLLNSLLYLIHKGNFLHLIKGQPLENIKNFSAQEKNPINSIHRFAHDKIFPFKKKVSLLVGISTQIIVIIIDVLLLSI